MSKLPFILPLELDDDIVNLFTPLASEPNSFFIDASVMGEDVHRYSVCGYLPVSLFESQDGFVTVDGKTTIDSPVEALKEFSSKMDNLPKDPYLPFYTMMVGYVGYEWGAEPVCVTLTENSETTLYDHSIIPDSWFGIFDTLLVYDHIDDVAWIVSLGLDSNLEPSLMLAKERAFAFMDRIKLSIPHEEAKPRLSQGMPLGKFNIDLLPHDAENRFNKSASMVKKELVNDPELSINLSCRFHATVPTTPWEIYKKQRMSNQSPYSSFINSGTWSLISHPKTCSLQIMGNNIVTRPIIHQHLPENNSDAVKNIVERSTPQSIRDFSADLRPIWKLCDHSTIEWGKPDVDRGEDSLYLTTTFRATTLDSTSPIDLLHGLVPTSDITGTPKKKALELISSTESYRRNIYTGSIGYITSHGRSQFSPGRRTMCVKDSVAYVYAGNWISKNSDALALFNESKGHVQKVLEDII